MRTIESLRFIPKTFLLGVALMAGVLSGSADGQEELLPTVEEILDKARRVNQRHPWVLLNERGLTLSAIDLPREEFLRGLSAAMDLVFSGTGELPETISLIVHSARADAVLDEIRRLDPFLTYKPAWREKRVVFSRVPNPTLGLSDNQLIARYRRPQPAPDQIRSDRGVFVPGALITEGTRFPIPIHLEVVPDSAAGTVLLLCNYRILKEFPYRNPQELDTALYRAQTSADRQKALAGKLDQIHHQVFRFPTSATVVLLESIARGATFLPHVAGAHVVGKSIRVRLGDGSELTWTLPKEAEAVYWSEPEAIQAAYRSQNGLKLALSRGAVVLVSEQFGIMTIENGFEFIRRMDQIVADGSLTLAQKELGIREEWKDRAEPVLEFFYTSLVDRPVEASPSRLAPTYLPKAPTGLEIFPNFKSY